MRRQWVVLARVLVRTAVWVGWAFAAQGAEIQALLVSEGRMIVVDRPYAIQGFRVADKQIANAETQGKRLLRIMGLKPGTTDIHVTGHEGEETILTVTVAQDIQAIHAALVKDLDEIPEVEISVNNLGRIMIRGEINSVKHWQYIQQVGELYRGRVANLTRFFPTPEAMIALKRALENAGLTVHLSPAAEATVPDDVVLRYSDNSVLVSGRAYNSATRDRVEKIIGSQSWLALTKSEQERDPSKIRTVVDITVVPTMLEVDVAFVALTDEEQRKTGMNLLEAGLLSVQATGALLGDAARGDALSQSRTTANGSGTRTRTTSAELGQEYDSSATYSLASDLAGTLRCYIASRPDRLLQKAHFAFRNGCNQWQLFHSGGTLKIRVASQSGADLKDIDYGLILKIKGGLATADRTDMDVQLELSAPQQVAGSTDWDLKRDRVTSTVSCPTGHTVLLSGMDKLLEGAAQSGTPVLRSVPLLRHLFSERTHNRIRKRVLILVSPRIAGAPRVTPPLSAETVKTLEEAALPPERRERKGKRRFFF